MAASADFSEFAFLFVRCWNSSRDQFFCCYLTNNDRSPAQWKIPNEFAVVSGYAVNTPQQSISLEIMPVASHVITLLGRSVALPPAELQSSLKFTPRVASCRANKLCR